MKVDSERYPLRGQQQRMLKAVRSKIEEARRGEHWRYEAFLSADQVGAMGEEIGMDELDAVEMFHRLWREGYFEATGMEQSVTVGLGQRLPFAIASVTGLTTKGLVEIGELDRPGERLIEAFEAAQASIERADIPEPRKGELLQRARLVIDALRTAEGLADVAGRVFGG